MTELEENLAISKPKSQFKIVDNTTNEELLLNRKALNMNRATKQWVLCLNDFLKERQLPDVDYLDLDQLPDIIGDFYFSARKKKISEEGIDQSDNKLTHYKNSSLKSGHAALNHYFKGTHGLDIISNAKFIKANEIFQAVTKQGKEQGRGETESKSTNIRS